MKFLQYDPTAKAAARSYLQQTRGGSLILLVEMGRTPNYVKFRAILVGKPQMVSYPIGSRLAALFGYKFELANQLLWWPKGGESFRSVVKRDLETIRDGRSPLLVEMF